MAGDFNLYSKGILNQFPTYSVAHVTTGSITVATATITIGGAYVNKSSPSGSIYAAYKDLWERLNDGQVGLIPSLTTTEITALTGIDDGVQVIDKTLQQVKMCINGSFQSVAGVGMMSPAAFGEMEEILEAGFTIGLIWITASQDVVDANGNVTFVSDDTNGDYLLIGARGAGTYRLEFLSLLISSTGNPITVKVTKNGTDISHLKETLISSTTEYKSFDDFEDMVLAAGDELRIVHSISSGIITATTVKLELRRLD